MTPASSMIWEYKVKVLPDFEASEKSLIQTEATLNQMGSEGGELVYLHPKSDKNRANCLAVPKRSKLN